MRTITWNIECVGISAQIVLGSQRDEAIVPYIVRWYNMAVEKLVKVRQEESNTVITA